MWNQLYIIIMKCCRILLTNMRPRKRVVTIRPEAPCYNSKLAEEKRLKRKYERKYTKSRLAIDRELYCLQRDKHNNLLMNTTKQDYFKDKVESATSTMELFKIRNNLPSQTNENILPTHSCGTELANRFVNYFGDKIKSIRQDLENSLNSIRHPLPLPIARYCPWITITFPVGHQLQD